MHHTKLRNADWGIIEERFKHKLSTWKAKHLSYGGRLILLNSVLSSLPMFMMSFFEIPKGVLKRLDFYHSTFFWQGNSDKKKYRLAKWDILCRPKDQRGLGIADLSITNKCLPSKWLFKLLNEDGTWQTLLRNKYLSSSLSQVKIKHGDSHFCKGLLKSRDDFLGCGTFKIKMVRKANFGRIFGLALNH